MNKTSQLNDNPPDINEISNRSWFHNYQVHSKLCSDNGNDVEKTRCVGWDSIGYDESKSTHDTKRNMKVENPKKNEINLNRVSKSRRRTPY